MTWYVVALALFALTYNNLTALWSPPRSTYVPLNLTLAAALLAAAWGLGLEHDELGFGGRYISSGMRMGLAVSLVVLVGLALALVVPGASRFLADRRVADLSTSGLLYTTLVRIPLGTIVLEEILFRSALYAAWSRVSSAKNAFVASCVLFGLWHIGPSLAMLRTNDYSGGPSRQAVIVIVSVFATAVAGAIFMALRLRTNSIVAPMLVHTSVNSLSTLAAFVWQQRS